MRIAEPDAPSVYAAPAANLRRGPDGRLRHALRGPGGTFRPPRPAETRMEVEAILRAYARAKAQLEAEIRRQQREAAEALFTRGAHAIDLRVTPQMERVLARLAALGRAHARAELRRVR